MNRKEIITAIIVTDFEYDSYNVLYPKEVKIITNYGTQIKNKVNGSITQAIGDIVEINMEIE